VGDGMKSHWIVFAALTASLCATRAPAADVTPWIDDEKLIEQVMQEVQASGIKAVEHHRDGMEQALANAKHSDELANAAGWRLTDGSADSLMAMITAASDDKSAKAARNPYPLIALALGSYYNEAGRADDALRALDAGIAIDPFAATKPGLIVERGNALVVLKRFDAVLANGDDGLNIPDLEPLLKAHLQRERGYALTELGRLDEAAAAYDASLKDDPGNATAEHELAYIARLKSGAAPAPSGGLAPLQQPKPQP
jgi:tetratricopeptide (TPR) repeat protein